MTHPDAIDVLIGKIRDCEDKKLRTTLAVELACLAERTAIDTVFDNLQRGASSDFERTFVREAS